MARHPRALVGTLSAAMLALAVTVPVTAQQDNAVAQPGGDLPGDPAIALVQVAGGLADPVEIADDGSGRLFVVERIGRIRVIDENGELLEEPFLDIGNRVKTDFLEQGLLGLAFAPDFADSGTFYVYYSDYQTNGHSRIVRYQSDGQTADPDSAQLVVDVPNDPYINHNAGTLAFGPDGFLYFAIGDGGLAGDPFDNAQDRDVLFGKISRIDVSVEPNPSRAYAIPGDNPFATASQVQLAPEEPAAYHPDARPEIWAWGLRNPWQFSFDTETGDLWLPDVGQNAWEEINFQPADSSGGENYGWDWLEGAHCYPETLDDCPRQQVGVLPVAEISHDDGDCSISGMGVHRSEGSEDLTGIYFASDFCSGRVWGLQQDDGGSWQLEELLDTALQVTGGGVSQAGDVYLTSCNCTFGRDYDPFADPQGAVWQVVAADEVPEGAETAPLEGEAEASPAPEDASPSPAASPAETEAPAESKPPAETEAPDETEPPAETEAPAETEPPAETEAPADSQAPGESQPAASGSPEANEGEVVQLHLVAADISFDQDVLEVPSGAMVELTLVNEDPVEHNFSVYEDEDAQEPIFQGELFSGPDAERVYEFQAPEEPGDYHFQCDPHAPQMNGTLVVGESGD